jgi:hypothetical protein
MLLSTALLDARLMGAMDSENQVATTNLQKENGNRSDLTFGALSTAKAQKHCPRTHHRAMISIALIDARLMGAMHRDNRDAVAKLKRKESSGSESTCDASSKPKAPKLCLDNRSRASLANGFSGRQASFTRSLAGRLEFTGNVGYVKLLDEKPARKKAARVHFSSKEAEVHRYEFNPSLVGDVFYTRCELEDMDRSRYEDAAMLRKQRLNDLEQLSNESTRNDVTMLLAKALSDNDWDEATSIKGIEHFVYPAIRREMIQRKDELRREVLNFAHSKRPDPQGWRLAQHSRMLSRWAQEVAQEKGMRYRVKDVSEYDDEEKAMDSDEE